MVGKAPYISADDGLHRERLIKISQFLAQKFEDIGEIKAGVQNAGQRISEIHLTVQNNQQRIETQAAQHQSELRSIMDDYQNKVENQFSQLEKKEQSKRLSTLYRESAHSP
jgi:iron uptake system EfeUOB component EfeO/EfeM